jgi:uroporphyrinogen-III synthase
VLKHSPIYLFSKTPYPDVEHIQILRSSYFQPDIDFSSYDYIIVTSKETISALEKIGQWQTLPVLAISQATAAYVKEQGGRLLDTAQGYGKSMASLIEEKYVDLKALYPHAKVTAFDMDWALKALGVTVESFCVYETSCSNAPIVDLAQDAICIFTSPSAIECFAKTYRFLSTYKVVCIGETTAAALPEHVKYTLSETSSVQSTIECAQSLLQ